MNNELIEKISRMTMMGDDDIQEIIDLVEQSQWINVSDRLPDENEIVRWWLIGKPPEECQHDSCGNPIAPNCKPYMYECKYNCWSSVMKPSHWQSLPEPPE